MTLVRTDPNQPNLINGTIYAYDIRPDGVYVTLAGNSETPQIVSFDLDDIKALSAIVRHFQHSTSFVFYVEPNVVECELGTVVTGLGSVGDGPEAACIATSSGGEFGDAYLTRDQLAELIEALRNTHEAMEA